MARRNEAAAGRFVNCKSAFSGSRMGLIPMAADTASLNNDRARDGTDFGTARGQAADDLAEPGRERTTACFCAVLRSRLCVRKSRTAAELRLPGVTKRVSEPFGPALARASHIC